jgi:hypothetical protein
MARTGIRDRVKVDPGKETGAMDTAIARRMTRNPASGRTTQRERVRDVPLLTGAGMRESAPVSLAQYEEPRTSKRQRSIMFSAGTRSDDDDGAHANDSCGTVPTGGDLRLLVAREVVVPVAARLSPGERRTLRFVSRRVRETLDAIAPLDVTIDLSTSALRGDPMAGLGVWNGTRAPTFRISVHGGGKCAKAMPYVTGGRLDGVMSVLSRAPPGSVELLEFRHVNFWFLGNGAIQAEPRSAAGVRRRAVRSDPPCGSPEKKRRLAGTQRTGSVGRLCFVDCIGQDRAIGVWAACSSVVVDECLLPVTTEFVNSAIHAGATCIDVRGDVRFSALRALEHLRSAGGVNVRVRVRRVLSCIGETGEEVADLAPCSDCSMDGERDACAAAIRM